MKRKMSGFAQEGVVSGVGSAPVSGKRTIGNSEVAGIGIASDIHQTATHAVTAAAAFPSGASPAGVGERKSSAKRTGPRTKPAFWRRP